MATGLASQPSVFKPTDTAEKLHRRLEDPKVAEGLNRLLDRVDSIAFAVEAFEGFVARGDVIANSVASAVSEFKSAGGENAESGKLVEFLEQAPKMIDTGAKLASVGQQAHLDDLAQSQLVARLTEPQTLALLNQLVDKLPLIAIMVESIEGFVRRGDTIAENVAGMVQELKQSDKKLDIAKIGSFLQNLPKFQEMGEHLLSSSLADDGLPKVIDAGVSMINSGMLDKDVVATLGDLGRATVHTFVEVKNQNPPPVGGLWAMMRASKDPDVQKSVGFFFAFAKAFAKHLS